MNETTLRASEAARRLGISTKQLLALSRRQPVQPSSLDLGAILQDMGSTLIRVLGDQIAFRTRGANSGSPIGAWVTVRNAVVFDVNTAFRYEDNIERLHVDGRVRRRRLRSSCATSSSTPWGGDPRSVAG